MRKAITTRKRLPDGTLAAPERHFDITTPEEDMQALASQQTAGLTLLCMQLLNRIDQLEQQLGGD